MASWIECFYLVVCNTLWATFFFLGSVLGIVYVSRAISLRFQSMKTSLESQGIRVSRDGVSLKTQKRFDRETYIDATQRGFVKVLGAAKVGPEANKRAFLPYSQSSVDATSSGIDTHIGRAKLPFGLTLHKSKGEHHAETH